MGFGGNDFGVKKKQKCYLLPVFTLVSSMSDTIMSTLSQLTHVVLATAPGPGMEVQAELLNPR